MTDLTDEINSFLPLGVNSGITGQGIRDAILALNNGALTVNDIVSGTIASISIVGMYQGGKPDLTDAPAGAATGALYILATTTDAGAWNYWLIDSEATSFTGLRLTGQSTIVWKSATGVDATVPDNYPKGVIGVITVANNIDAIAAPVTINLPITGDPARIYAASGSLQFTGTDECNGEARFTFTVKDAGNQAIQTSVKSEPVFDMQIGANGREYNRAYDFNMGQNGSVDVTVQLFGAWKPVGSYRLVAVIQDVGEGDSSLPINFPPSSTPVDLGSMSEDDAPLTITEAELLANATDPEGDPMTATNLAIQSGTGAVVGAGVGAWTYTPVNGGGASSVVFTYDISDDQGNTITNTASLAVIAVSGQPTLLEALMLVFRKARFTYDTGVTGTDKTTSNQVTAAGWTCTINGGAATLNSAKFNEAANTVEFIVDSADAPVTNDVMLISYDKDADPGTDFRVTATGELIDSIVDQVIDTSEI